MERVKEAVELVLRSHGGLVDSKTRLSNIFFLLENQHTVEYGIPLFYLGFTNYYFGPYSHELEDAVNNMREEGIVDIKPVDTPDGRVYNVILRGTTLENGLTPREKAFILDYIRKGNLIKKTTNELTDIVLQTDKCRKTPLGKGIVFAKVSGDMYIDHVKLTNILFDYGIIHRKTKSALREVLVKLAGGSMYRLDRLMRENYAHKDWKEREFPRMISLALRVHMKEFMTDYVPLPRVYYYVLDNESLTEEIRRKKIKLERVADECGYSKYWISETRRNYSGYKPLRVRNYESIEDVINPCVKRIIELTGKRIRDFFYLQRTEDNEKKYLDMLEEAKRFHKVFHDISKRKDELRRELEKLENSQREELEKLKQKVSYPNIWYDMFIGEKIH